MASDGLLRACNLDTFEVKVIVTTFIFGLRGIQRSLKMEVSFCVKVEMHYLRVHL